MLRVARFIEDHAADSAHYDERPVAHQEDRRALHRLHKAGPALPQGVLDAGAKAFLHGGIGLHLFQREVDGAALHLAAVPVQLALIAFQLVLHIAQGGLDLKQIGEVIRTGFQLLQTGALFFQAVQPGLDSDLLQAVLHCQLHLLWNQHRHPHPDHQKSDPDHP